MVDNPIKISVFDGCVVVIQSGQGEYCHTVTQGKIVIPESNIDYVIKQLEAAIPILWNKRVEKLDQEIAEKTKELETLHKMKNSVLGDKI